MATERADGLRRAHPPAEVVECSTKEEALAALGAGQCASVPQSVAEDLGAVDDSDVVDFDDILAGDDVLVDEEGRFAGTAAGD